MAKYKESFKVCSNQYCEICGFNYKANHDELRKLEYILFLSTFPVDNPYELLRSYVGEENYCICEPIIIKNSSIPSSFLIKKWTDIQQMDMSLKDSINQLMNIKLDPSFEESINNLNEISTEINQINLATHSPIPKNPEIHSAKLDKVSISKFSSQEKNRLKEFFQIIVNYKNNQKIIFRFQINDPPKWIDDSLRNECVICHKHFSLFRKRHHCRCCGEIICSNCLIQKSVPYLGYNFKVNHKS